MIIDDAFFGLSRAGTFQETFSYPGILESADSKQLSLVDEILSVFGQRTSPVVLPDKELSSPEEQNRVWISDDIVVIPNGAELIQRPRKLVERLYEVRKFAGYNRLIYLQGVSDPYLVPVLVYAGVAIFDDSTLRIESRKGIRYTVFGREPVEGDCYDENFTFIRGMLRTIRKSVTSGSLREIIEKYQVSSKAMEILRLLDRDLYGEFERTFPRRTRYIKANSLESLRRPDLKRYRDYMAQEYRKPEGREIAILMPCSARKPYSRSKSHKRIIEALTGFRNIVHEIIVTSPVGVVPRELEESYPAAAYDIPVIGEWYEDEKKMINELLRSFFSNNSYKKTVAFVDDDLLFIKDALPPGAVFVPWKKDNASLALLRKTVDGIVSELEPSPKRQNLRLETYIKIAEYQFGGWIAKYLKDCKIVKSYNNDMLVKEGKPAMVYNEKLGKFTINKVSAAWFLENGKFLVEIDDFKPTANVYAIGVINSTSDIRQEDEVVLHHKGEVRGVGIAKMPAMAMVDLKKGVAVKVRN